MLKIKVTTCIIFTKRNDLFQYGSFQVKYHHLLKNLPAAPPKKPPTAPTNAVPAALNPPAPTD